MSNLFTLGILLWFLPIQPHAETNVCDAVKKVTGAIKQKKYDGILGTKSEDDQYRSKIDIAAWENESFTYRKNESILFHAVFNATSYDHAQTTYTQLVQSLKKCLGVKADLIKFEDGETASFEISEKTKLEIDLIASREEDDWWIDMSLESEL